MSSSASPLGSGSGSVSAGGSNNAIPSPGLANGGTLSSASLASLSTLNAAAGADLPIANISRIMKRSLPENAKIAKEAKECVQDCVSELISFITSEASDKCIGEKRKTINGDDILYAMRVLGFDNYEEVLKVYLSRFRMAQENNPKTRRRSGSKRGAPSAEPDADGDVEGEGEGEGEGASDEEQEVGESGGSQSP